MFDEHMFFKIAINCERDYCRECVNKVGRGVRIVIRIFASIDSKYMDMNVTNAMINLCSGCAVSYTLQQYAYTVM
jgi:hypothetical protein